MDVMKFPARSCIKAGRGRTIGEVAPVVCEFAHSFQGFCTAMNGATDRQ
jgi:hypothetical protein